MELPSIEELNRLDEAQFKQVVCVLFEVAPPLERALLQNRPYSSYKQLIETEIDHLTSQEHLEILRSHPAIGQKKLKGFSKVEQGGDEPEEVYEQLALFNQQYEQFFGFPFLIFVNGRSKREICNILGEMLEKKETINKEEERKRALTDLFLIAHDRLRKATIRSSKL